MVNFIDIRLPNITGRSEVEQLSQIKSYLYQFAEQLQWAFNTMENGVSSDSVVLQDKSGNAIQKTEEAKAYDTFSSIKDLIIKSADIVEAYYEKIDNMISLDGKYVAKADFGDEGMAEYIKETSMTVCATPEYLEQYYTKTEKIDGKFGEVQSSLGSLDSRIKTQEGNIRSGVVKTTLTEDSETIGIEIGEIDTINGVTKRRYATFSAAGIELYGGSTDSQPVAYISQSKISITSAEFISSVKMGKYRLDLSNGIAFKWEEV